jgi:hypothetical protein
MNGLCLMATLLCLCAMSGRAVVGDRPRPLAYAPAPVDNPLKGLVPYQGDRRDRFPHSMEFNYVPYSALVKGYDEFDWQPLEKLLDDIAGRGHQAVLRVVGGYGGRPQGLLRGRRPITLRWREPCRTGWRRPW